MNVLVTFRDSIRRFVLAREMIFIHLWNMLVGFVGAWCIKSNFGYNKNLGQAWVMLAVVVVCAFLPMKGVSILLIAILIVDLYSLSLEAALVTLVIVFAGYLACSYFHSKNTFSMMTVPVCYSFGLPYVISLGTGLMNNINELTSVICGSIAAYYLHVIKGSAAAILDETSEVSILALLKEQMLMSKMFYFFLVAMIAMFLTVYFLRMTSLTMSWLIADAAGVVIEFIIMLSGLLLTSQKSEIPHLIIGNIIVFAVGFFLNYFILDLDYSRIEKVQFEDDDYYYYVTAVPKIRIVEEDKAVKKF